MNKKPVSRPVITILVSIEIVLTISLGVILAISCIIGKMGDVGGQVVLESVALALGIGWIVDLVCLVLALGVNSVCDDSNSQFPPDGPT